MFLATAIALYGLIIIDTAAWLQHVAGTTERLLHVHDDASQAARSWRLPVRGCEFFLDRLYCVVGDDGWSV